MNVIQRDPACSAIHRTRRALAVALAATLPLGFASQPAVAQSAPAQVSRPVVQPLPNQGAAGLDAALRRLARNPRDVEALIDAGQAALDTGDANAAVGFFRRADQVAPGNARVMGGLAGALVRNNDAASAIPLFEQAEKAGAIPATLAADRGLAHDLIGDNGRAQQYYRAALASRPNPEVTRRLALSHAMSGDLEMAEAVLLPLLQKQDPAAWRARAFVYAIVGQPEQAVGITQAVLPPELTASIAPYLRYMPRLTRAQQAAAANFGVFPRASEIGRDDPRIAQASSATATRTTATTNRAQAARSVSTPTRRTARRGSAPRVAPPDPVAVRQTGSAAAVPAAPPAPPPATAVAPAARSVPPAPPPPPPSSPPPTQSRDLAKLFGDLGAPSARAVPKTGAVDITRVTPAAPRPASAPTPAPAAAKSPSRAEAQKAEAAPAPPKKSPPSHPSRVWVQLGVGRDLQALAWDWRRFGREAPELFKGRQAFTSAWGATNRMLTGPFESEAAARSFVNGLAKENVKGPFVWISPAGLIVDLMAPR